jgi:hypothetical protein
MNTSGKTYNPITILGAQLRRKANAAPGHPAATNCDGHLVTLARDGDRWTLTISGGGTVFQTVCDRWATAVSAPSVEWRRSDGGRYAACSWTEVAK